MRGIERQSWRTGKWGTHQHHRAEHIRSNQRTPGSYRRAKIVSDHGPHRTIAQGRTQSERIPHQVEHAKSVQITIIRAVPPGGAPVAPLVGGNDVKPGRGQGQHNLAPAIGQLREAVQEQDAGTVLRLESAFSQVDGKTIDMGHEARAYTWREG